MSVKAMVACALLVVLVASGAASASEPSAVGDVTEGNVLRQLVRKTGKPREPVDRPQAGTWAPAPRAARRAPLSEDDRELMTKQIVQALSEMMSSDCMLDRDYQGWVDFGRRDVQ